MTEDDRQQAVRDHFDWCREALGNALIEISLAEGGWRLVIIDPDGAEQDLTAADQAANRRTVENIERFLAAHGISPSGGVEHGGPATQTQPR